MYKIKFFRYFFRGAIFIRLLKYSFLRLSIYRNYDGYGACPLTVAYGKVMLAEFCYGGKVTPSFPFDPTKPSSLYWQMKSKLFPWLQWNVMFKGKEWAKPNHKSLEK